MQQRDEIVVCSVPEQPVLNNLKQPVTREVSCNPQQCILKSFYKSLDLQICKQHLEMS